MELTTNSPFHFAITISRPFDNAQSWIAYATYRKNIYAIELAKQHLNFVELYSRIVRINPRSVEPDSIPHYRFPLHGPDR